jgi:hypothetical protein
MKNITIAGLLFLFGGIVIWILYGLYLGFEEIMQSLNLVTIFIGGLIIIGILVIFVSVIIDRYRETEEIKEKISKEDLEP